jgi:hypothetical protein
VNVPLIEVRVRHINEARGVHLCTWPSTQLDEVIPTLSRWGLNAADQSDISDTACGQFVVDESGAYFEVMYGNDED